MSTSSANLPQMVVDEPSQPHQTDIQNTPLDPNRLGRPRKLSIVASIASSHPDAHTGEIIHTGKSWAEKVEDPWLPLILTLDGGGIRGYSSLLILQRLFREVAQWETHFEALEKPEGERRIFDEKTLLPCHYFDYMYGTSTGGLIATMLGRLRMTILDCLEYYKKVGDDLFGSKRSPIPLATKYHHRPLEKAVREIVKQHCPVHIGTPHCTGDDFHPWYLDDSGEEPPYVEPYSEDSKDRICQSICLTATHNNKISEAYLLRTYNHRYNLKTPEYIIRYNEGADKMAIWQVTRATSAAPFFFKALVADIKDEKKTFKDGGIRENNPSVAAWSEFTSLYGNDKNPALLLSIGTGRPNMEQDGFETAWPGPFGKLPAVRKFAETFAVFKNMLVKYTQGEERHQSMLHQAKGDWTWYKRLNVDTGMENMKLDNWEKSVETKTVVEHGKEKEKKVIVPGGKSLKRMEDATEAYLARAVNVAFKEYAAPKVMLAQAAEKMVRHRRARERTAEQDPTRWDSYMGNRLRRVDSTEPEESTPRTGASKSFVVDDTAFLPKSGHNPGT